MRRIAVTALPVGWTLSIDDVDNGMVFRSGRDAERAARRLADRLARAGVWSEIRLHLRDGSLAARFLKPGGPRASDGNGRVCGGGGRLRGSTAPTTRVMGRPSFEFSPATPTQNGAMQH